MAEEKQSETSEVRVVGFSNKTKKELINIAKHMGVTYSGLLKPVIIEFINSKPEHMRKAPPIN